MQHSPSRRSRALPLVLAVCLFACSAAAVLRLLSSPARQPPSLVQHHFVISIGKFVPDGSFLDLASVQSVPLIRASPAAASLTVPPSPPPLPTSLAPIIFVLQVIMFDPDAPSPSSPTCRSWLHWLLLDASAAADSSLSGRDLVPFAPPSPPPTSASHRYFIRIYQQPSQRIAAGAPLSRCKFDVDAWASAHSLQLLHEQMFQTQHR